MFLSSGTLVRCFENSKKMIEEPSFGCGEIPNEKGVMSESCCCSRRACGLVCGYRYSYSSSLHMIVLPFFSVELLTGRSASISGIVGFLFFRTS